MKQALEALENAISDDKPYILKSKEAITALRQAMEQAEKQEPSLWFAIGKDGRVKYTTDSDRALKWKQAGSYRLVRDYYTSPVHAMEQAEKQEPALWFIQYANRHELLWSKPKWVQEGVLEIKPFYAAPVYASDISAERVDETAKDRHDLTCVCGAVWVGEEMVCSPRKREWVGLTDEEVGGLTVFDGLTHIEVPILADFVRAIESKLKEKNCSAANNS
jgi:hypothetical protein